MEHDCAESNKNDAKESTMTDDIEIEKSVGFFEETLPQIIPNQENISIIKK